MYVCAHVSRSETIVASRITVACLRGHQMLFYYLPLPHTLQCVLQLLCNNIIIIIMNTCNFYYYAQSDKNENQHDIYHVRIDAAIDVHVL